MRVMMTKMIVVYTDMVHTQCHTKKGLSKVVHVHICTVYKIVVFP